MFKNICFTVFFFALVQSHQTHAAPLTGNAHVVDFSLVSLITGDIDLAFNTMSVSDWEFLADPVQTVDVELLQPGSYTRISGDVTVPTGHIGAHIEFNWNFNTFFTYMVWNVSAGGATYTIIDSDGDGVPGHAFNSIPFPGVTFYYEFETTPTGPAGPNVNLSLNVDGGTEQECTGNSSANVTVNAATSLIGGAELDTVIWTIDGADTGEGLIITELLSLGDHVIEATAVTTTGQSDVDSVVVTISDTTRPVVALAFLDHHGNEVTSARKGRFEISIEATDTCDPEPAVTSATATPSTTVSDGDKLFINRKRGIKLPVTSVSVTVSARDASGNSSFITTKAITVD